MGGEGARAKRMGAARSQPGSFIEIFLNNLHVLVSCVSNALSGSVIPTGEQAQGLERKCSVPRVHVEPPLYGARAAQPVQGWRGPACVLRPHGASWRPGWRPETTGPTAKSVPRAAAGWGWVAWRGALGGRGDCPPHSSGCGSGPQLVRGGGTWTGSQS